MFSHSKLIFFFEILAYFKTKKNFQLYHMYQIKRFIKILEYIYIFWFFQINWLLIWQVHKDIIYITVAKLTDLSCIIQIWSRVYGSQISPSSVHWSVQMWMLLKIIEFYIFVLNKKVIENVKWSFTQNLLKVLMKTLPRLVGVQTIKCKLYRWTVQFLVKLKIKSEVKVGSPKNSIFEKF